MGEFEVIKARKVGNWWVILCKLDNEVTPWATWRSNTMTGEVREHGHYFYEDQEELAHRDFDAR
jgi:hypothetical protein